MKNQTILVAGGTGYLGRHLSARLAGRCDADLVLLCRAGTSSASLLPLGPRVKVHALSDAPLDAIFSQHAIDVVINCVANYGRSGADPAAVTEANVNFPHQLLRAAANSGCRAFLNAGTSLPADVSFYAQTKRQFQNLLQSYPTSMLRVNFSLQHFYGPGEGPDRFLGRIIAGLARRVPELEFTAGEQQRDFIHVDDVVGAFETVLANISSLGAGCHDFEVGFGQTVRLRDLIELVKRLCQNTETQLLFGAIPYRPNEVMYSVASCDALHRLGWKPIVDLETGLLQVISAEKKARIAA